MNPSSTFVLRLAFLLLALSLAVPNSLSAQKLKEVEIEVAGPWGYVEDPKDSSRIVVVTPTVNHSMDVIAGGDANAFKRQLDSGVYSLNFTPVHCAVHLPVAGQKLRDVTIDSNAISGALGATGKRFAVSLPKPCYFETYLDSRAKISTAKIDAQTPEDTYSIWMALHYTVVDSTADATFVGTSDSTGPIAPETIKFTNSAWPPTAEAISVIAYYGNAGEDYPCDQHSADHFDAAMKLWSLSGVYRLFPELDASGKQTHRYNYNLAKCSQTKSKDEHNHDVSANELKEKIDKIRQELPKPHLGEAQEKLQSLKKIIFQLWYEQPPRDLQEDLDSSIDLLRRIREGGGQFPANLVPLFLKVTEGDRAPGRADCHAMQINVNNTVP